MNKSSTLQRAILIKRTKGGNLHAFFIGLTAKCGAIDNAILFFLVEEEEIRKYFNQGI